MKENLQETILDFVEYCELEKGLSPRTAQKYDYRLQRFVDWLTEHKGSESLSVADITEETIKEFRLHLHRYTSEKTNKPLAPTTQQHYLVALRAFLRFLKRKHKFSRVYFTSQSIWQESDFS